MVRGLKPLILSALGLTLTACNLGSKPQSFPEAICERVNIASNGKAVIGVEDMAYDSVKQTLYLSAYDRRTQSLGGIYSLDMSQNPAALNLSAKPIIDGIRPHGMDITRINNSADLKDDNVFLSFIDRQGDNEAHKPIIQTLSWHDQSPAITTRYKTIINPDICAANDLTRASLYEQSTFGQSTFGQSAFGQSAAIYITQDHKSCTRKAQNRENILSPNRASAGVVAGKGPIYTPLLTKLSFANGITISEDNQQLYIAETRKKRITLYNLKTAHIRHIKLAGGPDNLTRDGTDIYAAIIPNLLQFLRFKSGKDKTSPSRFAILSMENKPNSSDILAYSIDHYDVPAAIISGATVAVKAGEYIWLGAAYDSAIARCQLPDATQ